MKEFIKNKYYYFVESITNLNEMRSLIGITDEVAMHLESGIQEFLTEFSGNFLEKMKRKDKIENMKREKEKLKNTYIFFAYLNKANECLKQQHYESAIRLINIAYEKYLKTFSSSSYVYKRGEKVLATVKKGITNAIEEKLNTWLVSIVGEQEKIGEILYRRLQQDQSRTNTNGSIKNNYGSMSTTGNIRNTKNIVDNLLLIRNTTNLNYMMNKNSVLKNTVLHQAEGVEEFDIINMVSNVDLNFLEQAYTIYKRVDIDTKFIDHFLTFRQSQLQSIIKVNSSQRSRYNMNQGMLSMNYDVYFSDVLGFLIIQIAVFELLPVFYTKRKFEEIINYFLKELISNLSFEFNNLTVHEEYISLEKSIFIFSKAVEKIGISERIGIDIKSSLLELIKSKSQDLNFLLIKKYNNIFVNLLCEEKFIAIEVKNHEELVKYFTQYSMTLSDLEKVNYSIASNDSDEEVIYPYRLPYTNFVVEVNENFKNYVNELFEYIEPLYNEYDDVVKNLVINFLKKFNEVFYTFSNFQEQDLNIILAAHVCNNIKYIVKSKNFYLEYVMKKCCNSSDGNFNNKKQVLTSFDFPLEQTLKSSWENYEGIIYENLKNKIRQFISEIMEENWSPEKSSKSPHIYVEEMIGYLSIIYESLQIISPYYTENCFKDVCERISKIYLQEIFFETKNVKNFNIYFIENLNCDIESLSEFINGCKYLNNECLNPMRILLNIFLNKKIEIFFDKSRNDPYYNIKISNLIEFMAKYKNLKNKTEMKGKITESDISGLIKKLKEYNK